jgi:RND family efflux transporter MFP subunit
MTESNDHSIAATLPHEAPRRSRRLVTIATVLVIVGAAGAYLHYSQTTPPAAANTPPPAPTVSVSQPLSREITEWDEFTGQFEAVDMVEVRARVSGYLTEVKFRDGEVVKRGDVLFQIDPRPYEAALAAARAQLAQASAQAELASRQLARTTELRNKGFETGVNYDQRTSDLKVATASAEAAKAAIRTAELNLEFTRITAPISGRIGNRQVSVGNLVNGGDGSNTTLLTTIVSLDPIYFGFDMSEADYLAYQRAAALGRMKSTRDDTVGVQLHLVDERGWPHEGRMNFVDNRVDRMTGTIRARAVFANTDLFLTPGQFARIRIPGSEPHTAVLVPDAAVVTDQARKLVMVVDGDGSVEPRVVRPGPSYRNLRIIRSGLAPTDRVVIDGLVRAQPGAKVTPRPAAIELDAQDNHGDHAP